MSSPCVVHVLLTLSLVVHLGAVSSIPVGIGTEHTTGVKFSLTARQSDCDSDCLNRKAIEITNEIRARNGVDSKLVAGPSVMLENAKDWSKHQMDSGMQHQSPLPALGCGLRVNRENVAMFAGMKRDPAEQCMRQWENSPGHKANIVNAQGGDFVSVGIEVEGNRVFCTQTFSRPSANPGSGSCAPGSTGGGDSGGGSSSDEPSSKDNPPPTGDRPEKLDSPSSTGASGGANMGDITPPAGGAGPSPKGDKTSSSPMDKSPLQARDSPGSTGDEDEASLGGKGPPEGVAGPPSADAELPLTAGGTTTGPREGIDRPMPAAEDGTPSSLGTSPPVVVDEPKPESDGGIPSSADEDPPVESGDTLSESIGSPPDSGGMDKPVDGGGPSSTGERRSFMGQRFPSVGDGSPPMRTQAPAVEDRSPPMRTKSPPVGNRSPSKENRSPSMGSRSPSMEGRSMGGRSMGGRSMGGRSIGGRSPSMGSPFPSKDFPFRSTGGHSPMAANNENDAKTSGDSFGKAFHGHPSATEKNHGAANAGDSVQGRRPRRRGYHHF